MKKLTAIAILAVVGLCGCTALGGSAPATPAATVAEIEAGYNAASAAFLAYANLPRCGQPTSPVLCSQGAVIAKAQQADTIAYNALIAAEATARDPNAKDKATTATIAAQQALAALTATMAQLGIPMQGGK